MIVNLFRSAIAMTCVATCLTFAGALTASGTAGLTPEELAQLDLAQLAQVNIVSVDKRAEPLADAAAAVRVVSSEDIARSGATSIPEALRNVPGLNVAQINGPTWAIGARGFQSEYAAKLLVMEDGVSVYTPLFSGVFWDQQNYFLPDIDQMEVVLGPGGSIWGANAMNGVINVITKSARDTQGGLLYAGSGNEKQALAGARYGWQVDTNTFARIYAKYNYNDPTRAANGGGDAYDATSIGQAGFRLDGYPQEGTQWTLKGDFRLADNQYRADLPDLNAPPSYVSTQLSVSHVSGAQVMGRWQRDLTADSHFQLQAYYDYSQRKNVGIDATAHTADLELHHTWTGWQRQVIDWGLDGRMAFLATGTAWPVFDPNHEVVGLGSGFLQDEIELWPERLFLTGGVKLEGHSNSEFLPEPNVRLTWHPAANQTIWAAWSRALRSPSEIELNSAVPVKIYPPGTFNPTLPTLVEFTGNRDVRSEHLSAWEIGWRWEANSQLSFDVDGYFYHYDNLIMATFGTPYAVGSTYMVQPAYTVNGVSGDEYGGEAALTWRPCASWFATASYSIRRGKLSTPLPDPLGYGKDSETAPQQNVSLVSGLKFCRELELSGALRYLDNVTYYHVPAYLELDAQLTWRPNDRWEVALVGQNLLHDHHAEYKASLVDQSAEIERGVYAKVTWKF